MCYPVYIKKFFSLYPFNELSLVGLSLDIVGDATAAAV